MSKELSNTKFTLINLIEKTKKLGPTIEKTFNNDLDKILDVMISEFDIYYRGSSDKVSKEILYEKFCFRISESSDKFINNCSAITNSGTPCSNKKYKNSKYCKKHMSKEIMEKYQERFYENSQTWDTQTCKIETIEYENNIDITKLTKKFIDDSFYYIDDKFIYDTIDYRKVGYVDSKNFGSDIDFGNNEDRVFVLTEDPFILCNL
jgi:hypothetical protein